MITRFCVGMLTPAIRATVVTPQKSRITATRNNSVTWVVERRALYEDSPARQPLRKIHASANLLYQIRYLDLNSVQDPIDLPGHFRHISHAVHRMQQALGLIIRQDRRGLLPVGDQTGLHGLRVVVGAPGELGAAALVADPILLRPGELVVVARAAFGAGETTRNPLDQRRV